MILRLHYWLEQLAQDLKWGYYIIRSKRFRRKLLYSHRRFYDNALRPRQQFNFRTGDVSAFSYPEALYATSARDFVRAEQMLAEMKAEAKALAEARVAQERDDALREAMEKTFEAGVQDDGLKDEDLGIRRRD